MDPLDILMNKELAVPYFKPIISADKQLVVGYEIIPKVQSAEGTTCLEWFFKDRSIPDEFRLEMSDYVQQRALQTYLAMDQSDILLFKYDAALLLKDNGETFLACLDQYNGSSLAYEKIVLEITEYEQLAELNELKHLLTYLQSAGIRIAIGSVGKFGSNLDRIAFLKPNIIKVNVAFIEEESISELYREVHHSLTLLSRKIGATLLFVNISNFKQFNYAWRNGSRYYQGDYLEQAKPSFARPDCCLDKMKKEFQHFIVYERKRMEARLTFTNELSAQLKKVLKTIDQNDTYDEMIMKVAKFMTEFAFRIYLCNADGFQQSADAEKNAEKKWVLVEEGRLKNWSWRPYFLENIIRMNIEKRGILSDLYTDIERDERIRTYSYPVTENLYLFLDIPYDYLFESEGLL
ncbi:EAL domain-containing protein [bacterium LRH843]|nr:EAL domain-containing protein [bacterium LRH843]